MLWYLHGQNCQNVHVPQRIDVGSAHVLTSVKNGETSVFVAIDHDECGDLTDVKKYQRVDALA